MLSGELRRGRRSAPRRPARRRQARRPRPSARGGCWCPLQTTASAAASHSQMLGAWPRSFAVLQGGPIPPRRHALASTEALPTQTPGRLTGSTPLGCQHRSQAQTPLVTLKGEGSRSRAYC
jgi:hypothetical protein